MKRDDFDSLLAFKANGTLEGEELTQVEAALADDADLRAELAAMEAIRETMQAEEVHSPGEFGLARLMRDVEAEGPRFTQIPAETGTAANDNVVPLTRLRIWQVAAAVVLALGIGFNLPNFNTTSAPEIAMEEAEPAFEGGFGLASGQNAADFTVVFSPDATEAEIRALLLEAGVEITSGPSALGLYGLGLLEFDAGEGAREILAASQIVDDLQ